MPSSVPSKQATTPDHNSQPQMNQNFLYNSRTVVTLSYKQAHLLLPKGQQESILGPIGKRRTAPSCDCSCCGNGLLPVSKQKGNGHPHGGTERNRCIYSTTQFPSSFLCTTFLAGNSQPTSLLPIAPPILGITQHSLLLPIEPSSTFGGTDPSGLE